MSSSLREYLSNNTHYSLELIDSINNQNNPSSFNFLNYEENSIENQNNPDPQNNIVNRGDIVNQNNNDNQINIKNQNNNNQNLNFENMINMLKNFKSNENDGEGSLYRGNIININ
jgi:hypothetical protein